MKMMLERRGIAVRAAGAALVKMDARLSACAVTENSSSAANRKRFSFMMNFDSAGGSAFKANSFSYGMEPRTTRNTQTRKKISTRRNSAAETQPKGCATR